LPIITAQAHESPNAVVEFVKAALALAQHHDDVRFRVTGSAVSSLPGQHGAAETLVNSFFIRRLIQFRQFIVSLNLTSDAYPSSHFVVFRSVSVQPTIAQAADDDEALSFPELAVVQESYFVKTAKGKRTEIWPVTAVRRSAVARPQIPGQHGSKSKSAKSSATATLTSSQSATASASSSSSSSSSE
jgi:hypothetical protein